MRLSWSALGVGSLLCSLALVPLPVPGGGENGGKTSIGAPRDRQDPTTLIDKLRMAPPDGRKRAAQALGEKGALARAAIPALTAALKDRDEGVRVAAATALCRIDRRQTAAAVPVLVAGLKSSNASARGGALIAFNYLGPEAEAAVPALLEVLSNGNYFERGIAAWALWQAGKERKDVPPALVAALKREQDPSAAAQLMMAVGNFSGYGKLGPATKDAVPVLVKYLGRQNRRLQGEAMFALGNIGPDAKAAVPALKDLLKDREPKTRAEAVDALDRITAGGKDGLEEMAALLKDPDRVVRIKAARAVARIEPAKVAEVIPELTSALQDRDKHTRSEACAALAACGPLARTAAPALVGALKDEYWVVRSYAATALGGIHAGKGSIPALAACLKDEMEPVRWQPAMALAEFGPAAKEAVPGLEVLLKDQSLRLRLTAAGSLISLDPSQASKHLPLLLSGLKSADIGARVAAARALWKAGPAAKAAVPELTVALKDQYPVVRNLAARALGRMGPEAMPALPTLQHLQQSDPQDYVRESAAKALREIEGRAKEKP